MRCIPFTGEVIIYLFTDTTLWIDRRTGGCLAEHLAVAMYFKYLFLLMVFMQQKIPLTNKM